MGSSRSRKSSLFPITHTWLTGISSPRNKRPLVGTAALGPLLVSEWLKQKQPLGLGGLEVLLVPKLEREGFFNWIKASQSLVICCFPKPAFVH